MTQRGEPSKIHLKRIRTKKKTNKLEHALHGGGLLDIADTLREADEETTRLAVSNGLVLGHHRPDAIDRRIRHVWRVILVVVVVGVTGDGVQLEGVKESRPVGAKMNFCHQKSDSIVRKGDVRGRAIDA